MVINRRGEDEHIRLGQQRINDVHAVVLDAPTAVRGVAGLAGPAAVDIEAAYGDEADMMARAFRTGAEGFRHADGVPRRAGAAVQYENVHRTSFGGMSRLFLYIS